MSGATEGFRLCYDRRAGADGAPPVVLLHGWPGSRGDWQHVVARLGRADVVVPDLRGFGESDKPLRDPAEAYSAAGQARSVIALIEELGLRDVVLGGYDIGSRIAQGVAAQRPDLLRTLVIAPPLPGAGRRVLDPAAQREFWYQSFHQLALAERLVDGSPAAVRAYLTHFWFHWSSPGFQPDEAYLDRLTEQYAEPGAFAASIGWYRAGPGTVARSLAEQAPPRSERVPVPVRVLWPADDPLFPVAWSDRIGDFYENAALRVLPGCGHFSPIEAPAEFAAELLAALGAEPDGTA